MYKGRKGKHASSTFQIRSASCYVGVLLQMHENWRSEKMALALFLLPHDENEFPSCISYNSLLLTSFILSHHMVVTYFLPPWKGFCSGMESYRLPVSVSFSELKYFSFVRGNRGRRVSVLNGHFGVCSRSLLNAGQTAGGVWLTCPNRI